MTLQNTTRTHITINAQAVPLVARVNRRAKRLILKVDPISGEIFVTAPTKSSIPEAIDFAIENSTWISRQMRTQRRAQPFCEHSTVPIYGVPHHIERRGGARSAIAIDGSDTENPTLRVGGEPAHINRRITDWMKREARTAFTERVSIHCATLGKYPSKIRIRDARTRWGSCSTAGVLNFTWRLIMAPPFVLDYVAAHECSHLLHMHHGPAFWREVARLGVDSRQAENWLKAEGPALFCYGAKA